MTIDIPARLAQLGMTLPGAPTPRGAYQSVVIHRDIAYVSGQVSRTAGGIIAGPVDRGTPSSLLRHAAQTCVLRALSALVAALPVSSSVERVLFLRGFINAVPSFVNHGAVMDEASAVLHEVFGDTGRHSRSALGVSSLPGCGLLEIELTVALTHERHPHAAETRRQP